MTGTMPASIISRTGRVSTATTSPTKPRSGSVILRAWKSQLPCRGFAFVPRFDRRATRSGFTVPFSVRRTISIVSSSVTRWPATNFGSWPDAVIAREIALPPPCTMATFMPIARMKAISSTTDSRLASISMTDPPSLTRTIAPLNAWMYGNASVKTAAFVCAVSNLCI